MMRDDAIGVMRLGGIARKQDDQYSDIDIAIFSHNPLADLTLGERISIMESLNITIDEYHESRGEIKRETYQECHISSDKTGKSKPSWTKPPSG